MPANTRQYPILMDDSGQVGERMSLEEFAKKESDHITQNRKGANRDISNYGPNSTAEMKSRLQEARGGEESDTELASREYWERKAQSQHKRGRKKK